MITRQRIVSYGIPTAAAATIITAALLTPWSRGNDAKPSLVPVTDPITVTTETNQIDVVFAVDTTGSMGGLLEGAKRTVWSIATHIRKTDPNANLRIGLVAYRDIGDDYVTRPYSLTTDLDAVFAELATYQAAGGGDTPENVDAALDDTLHKMQWRGGARKLVFLVGDAPPASRGEVPTFEVLAQQARDRGIIINTIRCGNDHATAQSFQRIASLSRGEFSSIEQDGGVQQVATPYDAKMAELSARIDSTSIIVGDDSTRRRHEGKMAAAIAAAPAAKADRATYYAAKKGKPGAGRAADDLVGGVASGTMDLDTIEESSLPSDLRGKDKAALKAEVTKRFAERQLAEKEIVELAKQRDEYLKNTVKDGAGFDAKVKTSIEKQLK
ncbi:MAG: VWA domain-containing protein [Myxococcota bacterium]|nr:VWA domain-containing protein [Myxococcota bacterium]